MFVCFLNHKTMHNGNSIIVTLFLRTRSHILSLSLNIIIVWNVSSSMIFCSPRYILWWGYSANFLSEVSSAQPLAQLKNIFIGDTVRELGTDDIIFLGYDRTQRCTSPLLSVRFWLNLCLWVYLNKNNKSLVMWHHTVAWFSPSEDSCKWVNVSRWEIHLSRQPHPVVLYNAQVRQWNR